MIKVFLEKSASAAIFLTVTSFPNNICTDKTTETLANDAIELHERLLLSPPIGKPDQKTMRILHERVPRGIKSGVDDCKNDGSNKGVEFG